MRVGILTFHCAHNYGAVLQCYALQEVLRGMGNEVEVINYCPSYLTDVYKVVNIHRVLSRNPLRMAKRSIVEVLTLSNRIRRYRGFDRFINSWLTLSASRDVTPDYDVYVMGSDQIWNPSLTHGFDGRFFGDFPFPKEGRKYVSYAASMEATDLSGSEKAYYAKALQGLDSISVREACLAELLRPMTEKKIDTVLDPTLLAPVSVWKNFLGEPKRAGKYVLAYQVRRDNDTLRIAHDIARQLNAEVVVVMARLTWKHGKSVYQAETPEEFVNWIRNAACVVTNSFHGTAFSVIFNRPFYCLRLGKGDTRPASLLEAIGLTERMIDKNAHPIFSVVNYGGANRKLEELRSRSLAFLGSALSK